MAEEEEDEGDTTSGSEGPGNSADADFCLMQPLCVALIKDFGEPSLSAFQEGFSYLGDSPSPRLGQYVLFPFVYHLKGMTEMKDKVRTKFLLCCSDVLTKFDMDSFSIFVEVFQRLHFVLGMKEDVTQFNISIPEDQMDACLSSVEALCQRNLKKQWVQLFDETKFKIVAHSIFVLLQVAKSEVPKASRLKSMDIILLYISSCKGKEAESKRLWEFLPGIVSAAGKVVDIRKGKVMKDVILKGMKLILEIVCTTVEFQEASSLTQADTSLSALISMISKELVLCKEVEFNDCMLTFSETLLPVLATKMPMCRESLLNNLLILNNHVELAKKGHISRVLEEYQSYMKIGYNELLQILNTALSQLEGKNEDDCQRSLSKLSSLLSLAELNYFEVEQILDLLFSLISEVSVMQKSALLGSRTNLQQNPLLQSCYCVSERLVSPESLLNILDFCISRFASFDGDVTSNFFGCVKFCNFLFLAQMETVKNWKISEDRVLWISEHYIELLEVESTELVLNALESEAPRTQTLLDCIKAELLSGMGSMGKLYTRKLVPVVLYPLIENAGLSSSPTIEEAARTSLVGLALPSSMREFLSANLPYVLSDLSVRIQNLVMYPNSPNSLIFLAEYFDFSQSSLIKVVDQAISRSCDPFSGGQLQLLYGKVFYSFLLSLSNKDKDQAFLRESSLSDVQRKSLYENLCEHQKAMGLGSDDEVSGTDDAHESVTNDKIPQELNPVEEQKHLPAHLGLTKKICHRVLNFLPNTDRAVRLISMDCLIKGLYLLRQDEETLLPLAHIIWQNLVPRIEENDYVVVRKAFELLLCLCYTCGSFLKKRTLEEIFPKLSSMLINMALESEQVKEKNRSYYTYTQAYKLQLTVLQGLSEICQCIDIEEEDLHKVVDGCVLYLKPAQHKNLRAAAVNLIKSLASENCSKFRSIWMKLIVHKLHDIPNMKPNTEFCNIPDRIMDG